MNALAQVERDVIESPRATGALTKSGTDAAALIQAISAAAANPQTDIEKMERLWAMHERIVARDAEQAFNESMGAAQGDMGRISADATNKQTHSKYATYGQLDRHVRPVYTAHGFSLSFDTADGAPEGCLRVLAYVSHKAGHTRTYRADVPADGKGAKGGDVMTKTHATGSAMSYGMRYLLKMIFNIAIGEDDDDGNAAGGNYPEPQQQQRQDASGRPVWPDESFNTQYARWTKAVEQGLKTVADIEAMATAKGAHTADSQRHHEWEDTARMASEGWGRLSFQIKALLVLVIVLAGIVLGSFLGTKVTRWLSSLDWSALSLIAGGKS